MDMISKDIIYSSATDSVHLDYLIHGFIPILNTWFREICF